MLPTWVTVTRIRDKFEADGTVQDVLKGRCRKVRSSTDNESANAVMQVPASISRFNPSRLLPLGNFKEHMYSTKPQTLEELRDQIEHAINDILLATIQMVCCSVQRRCWEYTVADGGHFERVPA